MSKQLGPIEIECDSPPYSIVRACHRLGFKEPEDVRWCRLSQLAQQRRASWRQLLWQPWIVFLGLKKLAENCFCGDKPPRLEKCTFTLRSGMAKSYRIGQCTRCRTIFWEEG